MGTTATRHSSGVRGVHHILKLQAPQQGEGAGHLPQLVQGTPVRGGGPHTKRIPGTGIGRLRGEESGDGRQPCKEHHQVGCRGEDHRRR